MKFEIWEDNEEQWDPNNIDPPYAVVDADEEGQAALEYMDDCGGPRNGMLYVSLILRDLGGNYTKVTVRYELSATVRRTTLDELCAP